MIFTMHDSLQVPSDSVSPLLQFFDLLCNFLFLFNTNLTLQCSHFCIILLSSPFLHLGWILALRYCSALHFGVLGFPPGGGHHHKKTTRQLGLEPDSSEGLKEYFHQNQWNISGNEFVKTHRILWGT